MQAKYQDGQPCKHKGCLSHISHPCEGCGRVGGIIGNLVQTKENRLKEIQDRYNYCHNTFQLKVEVIGKVVNEDIPYLLTALKESSRICYKYKENSGKLFERVQELEAALQEAQEKIDSLLQEKIECLMLQNALKDAEVREQGLRDVLKYYSLIPGDGGNLARQALGQEAKV